MRDPTQEDLEQLHELMMFLDNEIDRHEMDPEAGTITLVDMTDGRKTYVLKLVSVEDV